MTMAAPIASSERIEELDVLRGFALFGVFTVHFVSTLYYIYPVDDAVMSLWADNKIQYALVFFCDVLFLDKSITLFSVLFGIGFWIQMERFAARGDGAERLYLRRLAILFVFGLINKFFLFPGDILTDYALLGFVLFSIRKLPARTMLIVGLALVFIISQLAYGFLEVPWFDKEESDLFMKEALLSNTYGMWVAKTAQWHFSEYVISLGFIPLSLFVLGRFLIGAWVARHRLIEKAREQRSLLKKIAAVTIPIGLICEGLTMALWDELLVLPALFDYLFHIIGVPFLALGYACVLILLCGSSRWDWLTGIFAPVGRMALTAYIGHGLLFLIFAQPFGIYLRPAIDPATSWLVTISVYLGISLFCRKWLQHFQFGPLEWLWRSLTYGQRQPLRHVT